MTRAFLICSPTYAFIAESGSPVIPRTEPSGQRRASRDATDRSDIRASRIRVWRRPTDEV